MSNAYPYWLPWLEVAFASPACLICGFLVIVLATIPLPNGCKCFLYLNSVALFSLALCQGLIAQWTSVNKRGIGLNELHYFPLIFGHQLFFNMATVLLLLLTCERLYLCYHPTFHESHKWGIVPCLTGAVLLLLSGSLRLSFLLRCCSSMLLLFCYRQSRYYYRTQFAQVNLNIRYQVKEVVELTRVLIPIVCISLFFKLLIEVLATFVFTDAAYISTSVLFLRFVSTTMAYVEPILLMLRHRSMSRKVLVLVTLGRVQPQQQTTILSSDDATRSYFTSLRREWG